MTRPILINCKPTANALRLELTRIELTGVELKSIKAVENKDTKPSGTIADVEDAGVLPDIKAVVFDPPGTAPHPGDKLVCKGSACLNGVSQRIAVYREAN